MYDLHYINYAFLYHMKTGLAKLKTIMRTAHITVYAMRMYGVDPTETWMYGDWFYTTDYAVFGHEAKAIEMSPPDNLTRWIITKSKSFTKNGIER